jgi:hypothetical protein
VLVLGLPATVRADPILVGAGWTAFSWTKGPGVFNDEGPFSFTTTTPATLKVTDAFLDGDRFEVYNDKTLIGTCSKPTDTGTFVGDPDQAFLDPHFSHGTWTLNPGSYALRFKTIEIASGAPDGEAFFRVDGGGGGGTGNVPEPGSLALAAFGALGLACRAWKRRRGAIVPSAE